MHPPTRIFRADSGVGEFLRMLLMAGIIAAGLMGNPAVSQTANQIRHYQEMLIWTGDYDGLIDGELGRGTATAIKNFQSRIGHNPSGVLSSQEVSLLVRQGNSSKQAAGFRQVSDGRTGISIGIPENLVSGPTRTSWGSNWKAPDRSIDIDTLRFTGKTLRELYDRLTTFRNRHVDYAPFRGDWFVVSGVDSDGSEIYVRAQALESEIHAYSVVIDRKSRNELRRIAIAMSSSFETTSAAPEPGVVRAPAGERGPAPGTSAGSLVPAGRGPASGPIADTANSIEPCFNGLGACPKAFTAH